MADWGEIKNRIVLEGEAGYKKAMADINRALREAKSEMKAVAAEYDASSDSAQALTANITALENVHEGQTLALETMRSQLDKVAEKYGENSREAVELRTKINNARAEMAKTSAQLGELRTRLDAASDAGEDMGGGMNGAAEGLSAVGREADRAQGEVESLGSSIADAMGHKLVEFEIGKRALDGLGDAIRDAVSWGFGEAIQGQNEDAMTRALAGNDALSERRTGIKDAVDRTWAGRRDGSETVGDVAAVDTALGNMGITDEAYVKHVTDMVITHNEAFGQSTQDTIDRAKALITTFGLTWDEALDLMTKGMQDMDDGGAKMISAFDTYPQVFKQIGYSAEEMYGAVKSAANDDVLGKDNALGKGIETFITKLTSGSKESQDALKALGIEATDLPAKFQEGGEAAAEATQLVLEKLQAIDDQAQRNDLGKALFGNKLWTDSGGKIVDVILSGYGQIVEASGATEDAMESVLDTWEAQSGGAVERFSQTLGQLVGPLVDAGTDAARAFNEGFDEGGFLKGLQEGTVSVADSITDAMSGGASAIGDWIGSALDDAGQSIDAKLGDISSHIGETFFAGVGETTSSADADATAQRWIDVLRGSVDAAAAEGEQSDAIKNMLDGMLPDTTVLSEAMKGYAESHKAAVVAQMEEAYGQEDDEDFEAWKAFQQAMIDSAYDDTVEQAGNLGKDAAQADVDAIEGAQPDAQAAGEGLGGAGITGLTTGLEGAYGIGEAAADGAVGGMSSRDGEAYAAGARLGGAFMRGYRQKMQINSPSKVMYEEAGYTTEGLFERFDEDEERLREAAAGLAEAVSSGYGGAILTRSGMGGETAPGMDYGALGQAVREAVAGLVVAIDGRHAGEILEPFASRATSRRATGTIRGQGTAARSW